MRNLLIACSLFLAACVTPSTMMVNREGKVMRCASYGYGNAMAIGAAEGIHSSCVRDAKMIGFEPIPSVTSGINYDHKSMPPRIVEVYGPAEAVGVQVGDLILEVDGKKIDDHFWVIKHLNTKRVGERVNLKVQRGENVLSFSMNLVNR